MFLNQSEAECRGLSRVISILTMCHEIQAVFTQFDFNTTQKSDVYLLYNV